MTSVLPKRPIEPAILPKELHKSLERMPKAIDIPEIIAQADSLPAERVKLAIERSTVPPIRDHRGQLDAQLFKELAAQPSASFVLRRAEDVFPSAASLLTQLDAEDATCSLVWSPPEVQGFPVHHDDVDAYIIQVDGSKIWRTWQPQTIPSSYTIKSLGPHYRAFVLDVGYAFYLPRGYPHIVRSRAEPTIHIVCELTGSRV